MDDQNSPIVLTCTGSYISHPFPREVVAGRRLENALFVQDPMEGGDLTSKPPSRGSLLFDATMYETPDGVWAVSDAGPICSLCLKERQRDFRIATEDDIALLDWYDAE